MATVGPVGRDDNSRVLIRCSKCGFEVPHASLAGRGSVSIDVEEWLTVCQNIEVAEGRASQCTELAAAQNRPIRPNLMQFKPEETLMTDEPVVVSLPQSQLSKLDTWIAQFPDPKPSRAEAVRRLVENGLRSRSEKLVTF
jgi:hypothetical protein